MRRVCEVCQGFRQAEPPIEATELIELGKRSVAVCTTHAFIVRWSGVETFEEIRELFSETSGRRSFVARRAGEGHSTQANERRREHSGRRAQDSR